jgi:hypothetical protein
MSSAPQLSGEVDPTIRLRREIAGLEQELATAREEAQQAKQASADSIKAIRALRRQLEPVYTAMKMVFGEISRVDAAELEEPSASPSSNGASLWGDRIARLPTVESRVLRVLVDGGGEMTVTQIRIAARTYNNTNMYLNRLIAKNWVQKTGRGTYVIKT